MLEEPDDYGTRLGERRTRLHRQAQKKLTRDTVGDNMTFDSRNRLAVRKGRSVEPLGAESGESRDAVLDFAENDPSSTKNAAQHNVAIENLNDAVAAHNDLVSDVSDLRRVLAALQGSLRAAKLLE